MPQERVLLLIPHLGHGGAERVMTLLAQHLSRRKYDLHLGLVTQGKDTALPALPASVTVHCLGADRVRGALLPLARLIQRLRPGVVLSSMAHLNFAVLMLRPLFPRDIRVLVRQNGTASAMLADARTPSTARFLYRTLYPRADRVLCQTESMADDLRSLTAIGRARLSVIPNPVDIEAVRADALPPLFQPELSGPRLLAVGRLAREKGYDILLNAFALVRASFPTATLTIAGEGAEEGVLKAHAACLGLKGSVRFLGYVETPEKLFATTSVFVHSSRHEGMPNALLEAAAAGLPLVVTPASGGMVDQLRDQPGAWLAREVSAEALSETLACALGSLKPEQRFPHAWIDRFSLGKAIAAYEAALDGNPA